MNKILSRHSAGNMAVELRKDTYGLTLYTIRNGFKWTGIEVDCSLLLMIKAVISEYLGEAYEMED